MNAKIKSRLSTAAPSIKFHRRSQEKKKEPPPLPSHPSSKPLSSTKKPYTGYTGPKVDYYKILPTP